MIYSSVTLMTLFDIAVIAACVVAARILIWHRKDLSEHSVKSGLHLAVLGLAVAGLFHTVDLILMHVFPLFMPMAEAMALMEGLNRDFHWLVSLFAIGSIVYGFSGNVVAMSRLIGILRESERRFRDVAVSAADWIWEMDENLRFSSISPRFFEIFPIAREDFIGKTREEFSGVTEYDENWHQHFDDLANRRPFRAFAYSTIQSDGRRRHILISGNPVFDADGTFRGYRGTGTDKTAEVEARLALEESEKQFRNLIEGSIQGVFVHEDWNILFANHALADIFGYRNPEEILALKRVEPLIEPDERKRLSGYRAARRRGEYAPEIYEARGLKKDGTQIWLEFRVTTIDWRGVAAMQCVVIDITERVWVEEALRESEELFSKAFHASPAPFAISRPEDGVHYDVNEAWTAALGYSREEALTHSAVELGVWADPARRAQFVHLLKENSSVRNFEAKFRTKNGAKRDFLVSGEHIEFGGKPRFFVVHHDVTALKAAEQALQEQNERFNAAVENMSQGLCMFDGEQRLVVCNGRYAAMYGLSAEQVKPGTPFRQIVEHRIANGVYAGDAPEEYIQERCAAVIEDKASTKIQELSDGRVIAISHQPMAGGGWLATHEDITDYRRIEERLAYLAHHDALTDLASRVLLRERLEEELKRARRGARFALLYLDLDGFKGINDTLGHSAGDVLLKTVGERLRNCMRETDLVARLGGDEFAIVQPLTEEPSEATALAERICNTISAPADLGHHEVVVGASIGIAVAPKDGADPDQLLRNADLALYHAKSTSRGAYCMFAPEMDSDAKDRHAMGLDLRQALARDELELHYQPLFNLKSNKVSSFEALLRWCQPERGMVSPADFIPVAEGTGLISEIGEWVLRRACAEAANWPDEVNVAVNVSPVQFKRGNLVQVVQEALSASGLRSDRLELEVTESVLLHDDQATLAVLHELQQFGIRLAMDDFGTGYSSLSYLRHFPFDKIKIDASFVSDLSRGDDDIGIVQAVVGLASRLGVVTTAEGVETEEQLEIIKAEGCTEAQGYYFSRPMPAKDIARLLPRRRKKMVSAA